MSYIIHIVHINIIDTPTNTTYHYSDVKDDFYNK